jgi:hypothetical protein
LKALKINLLYSKKADAQVFRSAKVQKPAREFSHGLDFRLIDQSHTYHNSDTTDHYILSENEENIYNFQ